MKIQDKNGNIIELNWGAVELTQEALYWVGLWEDNNYDLSDLEEYFERSSEYEEKGYLTLAELSDIIVDDEAIHEVAANIFSKIEIVEHEMEGYLTPEAYQFLANFFEGDENFSQVRDTMARAREFYSVADCLACYGLASVEDLDSVAEAYEIIDGKVELILRGR